MIEGITASKADELIARGSVDVIDVRHPGEWADGHLPGARLVPLERLRADAKSILDRDNVLFVCAAGVRSLTAARIATQHGLKAVYSLNGGTRGWTKAGFSLVKAISVAV